MFPKSSTDFALLEILDERERNNWLFRREAYPKVYPLGNPLGPFPVARCLFRREAESFKTVASCKARHFYSDPTHLNWELCFFLSYFFGSLRYKLRKNQDFFDSSNSYGAFLEATLAMVGSKISRKYWQKKRT